MKKILSIASLLLTTTCFAQEGGGTSADPMIISDELVLICSPDAKAVNGLGLAWARLHISQEDPEADMTYKYKNTPRDKTLRMHYDYEGTDTKYTLTPDSDKKSALTIPNCPLSLHFGDD